MSMEMGMDTDRDTDRAMDMKMDDILRLLTNYVGMSVKYSFPSNPKCRVKSIAIANKLRWDERKIFLLKEAQMVRKIIMQ